jgi:hypothetical protein
LTLSKSSAIANNFLLIMRDPYYTHIRKERKKERKKEYARKPSQKSFLSTSVFDGRRSTALTLIGLKLVHAVKGFSSIFLICRDQYQIYLTVHCTFDEHT